MTRTLSDLHEHLLYLICEKVHQSSPSSVSSLSAVSRALHQAAEPFVNRHVLLRLGPDASTLEGGFWVHKPNNHPYERIESWTSNPARSQVLRSIRSVRIEAPFVLRCRKQPLAQASPEEELEQTWYPISQLIRKLSHLERFQFCVGSQFPLVLLKALERYHPTVKLEILKWSRINSSISHDDPAELALAHSPCLDTISVDLHNVSSNAFRKAAFSRLINLSPRLKHIRLEVSNSGCGAFDVEEDPWKQLDGDVCSSNRTKISAERKLRNELFTQEQPVVKALTELKLRGVSMDVHSFDNYWSKFIDFSLLTFLDLGQCELSDELLTMAVRSDIFKGLRKLNMDSSKPRDSGPRPAVLEFLQGCRPLEALGLYEQYLPLDKFLTHHSDTLRSLTIHECEEPDIGETVRDAISIDELECIRDTCPNLERLGIDIDRSKDTTNENEQLLYRTLGTFPELQSLQIHFNLGFEPLAGKEDELNSCTNLPLIDPEFVRRIWFEIARHKVGKPLRTLIVKVGIWFRQSFGRPPSCVYWHEQNRKVWIAQPNGKCDGDVEVKGIDIDSYDDTHQLSFA